MRVNEMSDEQLLDTLFEETGRDWQAEAQKNIYDVRLSNFGTQHELTVMAQDALGAVEEAKHCLGEEFAKLVDVVKVWDKEKGWVRR